VARPLKYKDPEKVQSIIDNYFIDCDKRNAPYTQIGLANALDISRMTLYRYNDYKLIDNTDIDSADTLTTQTKQALCYIISRAVDKVEQYLAEQLTDRDRYKGASFLLSSNYSGYTQKQQVEISSPQDINISISD